MKIYDKTNFNELPDYVWDYWFKRLKKEIINTSYPLFMIRVGISDKKDEYEMYKRMFDIKEEKNDVTFGDFFYFEDKYIHIALNTIFDYVEMKHDDFL
jgi:hypothetical protein